MNFVYFVYGLAFFGLGLVVLLESRRPSALALSRHLPWLAWFGLTHAAVEWLDMFLLAGLPPVWQPMVEVTRGLLLPISAVLLVRFGVGLISEAGPLPNWMMLAPVALVVPAALLTGYALIVILTEPPWLLAADVWARYLLYGPGCLVAAAGFARQARRLPQLGLGEARPLLLGAFVAFLFNAVVAGLLVPPAPFGLAPWLNSDLALAATSLPVGVWRAVSALSVTVLVIRALGVFEAERLQNLERLSAEREHAARAALLAQAEACRMAEAWTNALVGINRSVANMDPPDAVLPAIVQAANQLLAADVAGLALWSDDGACLVLKCHVWGGETPVVTSQPLDDPVLLEVARAGRPHRIPNGAAGRWRCPARGVETVSASQVPLLLNGQALGVLWVGRAVGPPFTAADVTGLERLADQAVITLEHALMAARLQSLAVVEERGRIAREMHDGLSQVLGYLSLQMQTLQALVRQGDCAAAQSELEAARSRIREAQADVRESILSLRTTLSGQVGLIPALKQYVEEFGLHTGIQAEVVSDFTGDPCLSPLAEAQLMRIVQEALTNVRKHAHAECVHVYLGLTDHDLRVTISDNGRGFSPDAVGQGHFGLQTMSERAQSVGGRLEIYSGPGGTRLAAWLPRAV